MQALLTWLKNTAKFVWENVDAVFVVIAGLAVAVLEIVGNPSAEVINSAILGLLAVTAVVLLRDREARGDLADLGQVARDALSDLPYDVVWQTNHWDVADRENTKVTMTQQLRFIRNEVSTITHWSTGDGRIDRCEGRWRRSDDNPWIPAETIHEFGINNGKKVIFSLDEEHSRGDMLDWCVTREAIDRFPTAHEQVSVRAKTKSDHPRVLHVVWPPNDAPTHIEIRYRDQPARTLTAKRKKGRAFVKEKIANLPPGEKVVIAWTW
jgi:hypothetical protein